MVNDSTHAQLDDPAMVFIALWREAEQWSPTERSQALACQRSFASLLAEADPTVLCRFGRECLAAGRQGDAAWHGRVLALMRAIDESFYAIHPRCVTLPGAFARQRPLPAWLKAMRERRQQCGAYAEYQDRRLVARGPLTRACRAENAASADSLADRFSALEVVPMVLTQQGRNIPAIHRVISQAALSGFTRPGRPGDETVAVIPLAQGIDDLTLRGSRPNGCYLLDVGLGEGLSPVARLAEGLQQSADCDIAVCPEFVMPEVHANDIPEVLQQLASAPRLLVAGSGMTEVRGNGGLAWNESSVFNRYGAYLWRQRKLWPASMPYQRAAAYGVSFGDEGSNEPVAPETPVMEATDSGSELFVVDLDGLGRCAVLICQDIQGSPLANELVRCFQPDWIFVPILDDGIRSGNWVHQRAFALSNLAQTRYVIASSLSLAHLSPRAGSTYGYALAIAPLDSGEPRESRRMLLTGNMAGDAAISVALIHWAQAGNWQRTSLNSQ